MIWSRDVHKHNTSRRFYISDSRLYIDPSTSWQRAGQLESSLSISRYVVLLFSLPSVHVEHVSSQYQSNRLSLAHLPG